MMTHDQPLFDDKTWSELPGLLGHLPEPVRIQLWGDPTLSVAEKEAFRLITTLAERFETIEYRLLPRRINFDYYPVIGVMGLVNADGDLSFDSADYIDGIDYGVRIIGLPVGVQMTSLVAGIQCVSFRGMTSEAKTRIRLHRLNSEVNIEVLTAADDQAGTVMAQRVFNMAVANPFVRTFVIMGDAFPRLLTQYSVNQYPHIVINSRYHVEGLISEQDLLDHVAAQLRSQI